MVACSHLQHHCKPLTYQQNMLHLLMSYIVLKPIGFSQMSNAMPRLHSPHCHLQLTHARNTMHIMLLSNYTEPVSETQCNQLINCKLLQHFWPMPIAAEPQMF
jgi:hypothetical protein